MLYAVSLVNGTLALRALGICSYIIEQIIIDKSVMVGAGLVEIR